MRKAIDLASRGIPEEMTRTQILAPCFVIGYESQSMLRTQSRIALTLVAEFILLALTFTPVRGPAQITNTGAGAASFTTNSPTDTSTPEGRIAALEEEMKAAVQQVQKIVNQPVARLPRRPGMRVGEFKPGWFHEGASKPDFNNIDVRTTRETIYDQYDYVTSDLNPGIVFIGKQLEFNSSTKYFYKDRTIPKKKLTEAEMLEINRLYRIIGRCEGEIAKLKKPPAAATASSDDTASGAGGGAEKRPRLLNPYVGGGLLLLALIILFLLSRRRNA